MTTGPRLTRCRFLFGLGIRLLPGVARPGYLVLRSFERPFWRQSAKERQVNRLALQDGRIGVTESEMKLSSNDPRVRIGHRAVAWPWLGRGFGHQVLKLPEHILRAPADSFVHRVAVVEILGNVAARCAASVDRRIRGIPKQPVGLPDVEALWNDSLEPVRERVSLMAVSMIVGRSTRGSDGLQMPQSDGSPIRLAHATSSASVSAETF